MTSQFLPRGKNGPAYSFPGEKLTGEKTDRYTGFYFCFAYPLHHAVVKVSVNVVLIHKTNERLIPLPLKAFSFQIIGTECVFLFS